MDKPGVPGTGTGLSNLSLGPSVANSDEPVSGMLWVHLLAGRGLRPSTGTSAATTPVTPSGGAPNITSNFKQLDCCLFLILYFLRWDLWWSS